MEHVLFLTMAKGTVQEPNLMPSEILLKKNYIFTQVYVSHFNFNLLTLQNCHYMTIVKTHHDIEQ